MPLETGNKGGSCCCISRGTLAFDMKGAIMRTSVILVAMAGLWICAGAWAVVYVDKDNMAGPWNGASWATAFQTIQEGLDAAGVGEDVWVAEGIYAESRPNNTSGSLQMKDGVNVYGGFAGMETTRGQRDWRTHVTTISGATARSGSPAYHVILGANNATIDGFTIRDGRTIPSGGMVFQSWPD